jgi:hypothetical protein
MATRKQEMESNLFVVPQSLKGKEMAEHFITKCSCGNVIAQCRCPSRDKTLNIVERGCEMCHNSKATVAYIRDKDMWSISDGKGVVEFTRSDWEHARSVIHEHYHGED